SSPVAGLVRSNSSPLRESTHLPPIKFLNCAITSLRPCDDQSHRVVLLVTPRLGLPDCAPTHVSTAADSARSIIARKRDTGRMHTPRWPGVCQAMRGTMVEPSLTSRLRQRSR